MSCSFTCLTGFDLRQTGRFNVPDPFLTFHYVEKRNGILRKIGGMGLKIPTYLYMGEGGGSKIGTIIPT